MAKIRAMRGKKSLKRTVISSSKLKRGSKMAKRRRSVRRKGYSRVKRYSKKPSVKATTLVLSSGVYGALRQKISTLISPLTSKIPLGSYADNVGMGVLSYFAYKKGKGMIKTAGMAGLAIEGAMVGANVASGYIGSGQTDNSGNIF